MNRKLQQVLEFHKTYGAAYAESPTIDVDEKIRDCRISLLKEELQELEDAIAAGDLKEIFDALVDIDYVLQGTYWTFGLAQVADKGFDEVHASNMSKLGADGKPILREDGKILKGPNYFKPNLQKILDEGGKTLRYSGTLLSGWDKCNTPLGSPEPLPNYENILFPGEGVYEVDGRKLLIDGIAVRALIDTGIKFRWTTDYETGEPVRICLNGQDKDGHIQFKLMGD